VRQEAAQDSTHTNIVYPCVEDVTMVAHLPEYRGWGRGG